MSNVNLSASELGITPKDIGLQATPERSDLVQYKKVLEHVIPIFSAGNEQHRWDMNFSTEGQFEDKAYNVRFPHLRKGKHAAVGVVDITNSDGTTFSCVIRNDPEDAMSYLKAVEQNPIVAKYSPQLYGIVDEWVVIEKLTGLELEELQERLKTDPAFLSKYAQHAQALIRELADEHLSMDDVRFINGHNTMVDPETGEIRIIEQKSIHAAPFDLEPYEIETEQLFTEAEGIMYLGNRANVPSYKARFLYELFQNAFRHRKPEEFYVRSRSIKPTHPDYKDAWSLQNWEDLSEERHQQILADPNLRENFTVNYFERGFTQILDPNFIEAIIKGDFVAFQEIVRNGSFKANITDKNDPRSQGVVLPDSPTSPN